jgi:Caspase domain
MNLDNSHTKVILIGSSTYPKWPEGNIKNIQVNIAQMKDVLCDASLVGIRQPDNIIELLDQTKMDIQIMVNKITQSCTTDDSLIIYYSGHGMLDIGNLKKLYLTTKDTMSDNVAITCISSEDLKEPLIKCKASNKIMILDCCFAAKAAEGMMGDIKSANVNYWGNTEGVYFMMSSDVNEPSRFDPNDDTIPTFFTQKFVQTIKAGSRAGDDIWTLDQVFDAMKRDWDTKIAPEPISLSFKEIGRMPFCYNHSKFVAGAAPDADAEKGWIELQKNPIEENIMAFMIAYPQEKQKGLDLWTKMRNDWEMLNEAQSKNSFEALRDFLANTNPVPPVYKAALDSMKSISVEGRDPSQNKTVRRTRTSARDNLSSAASVNPVEKSP